MLRGDLEENAPILNDIAQGRPITRQRVLVRDVAPYLACPGCGELGKLEPVKIRDAIQEIEVMGSASPKERVAAIDAQAKYGLGVEKGVAQETVRENVAAMLAVIRAHVAGPVYDGMLPELKACWMGAA